MWLSSFLVSCILLNVAKTLFYSWNRPSCVLVCASVCLALLPAQFSSPFGQIWPLNKEEFEQTKTVIWLLNPDETWNFPLRRCSLSLSKSTTNNPVTSPSRDLYTQKITAGSMEVGDLPTEIILKILHYLPLGDTYQVCKVNKRLYSLFSCPGLWSH